MGQKTDPTLLRLNKTNQLWSSCWYSDGEYARQFLEDLQISAYIKNSSQQLKKILPVLFIKKQRGDLQIALFSTKSAQLNAALRLFVRHNRYNRRRPIPLNQSSSYAQRCANLQTQTRPVNSLLGNRIPTYETQRNLNFFKAFLFADRLQNPVTQLTQQRFDNLGSLTPTFFNSSYLPERNSEFAAADCKKQSPLPLLTWCLKGEGGVLRGAQSKEQGKNGIWPIPPVNAALAPSNPFHGSQRSKHIKQVERRTGAEKFLLKNLMECTIGRGTEYKSKIHLIKCPSAYQNALFLASAIANLLENRHQFRRLKHRIVESIQGGGNNIKGIRITCSGRVAARSKKAQKARTDSIQWGSTGTNVFSEHLDFASCSALTTFGKVGVKVWICYEKKRIGIAI